MSSEGQLRETGRKKEPHRKNGKVRNEGPNLRPAIRYQRGTVDVDLMIASYLRRIHWITMAEDRQPGNLGDPHRLHLTCSGLTTLCTHWSRGVKRHFPRRTKVPQAPPCRYRQIVGSRELGVPHKSARKWRWARWAKATPTETPQTLALALLAPVSTFC